MQAIVKILGSLDYFIGKLWITYTRENNILAFSFLKTVSFYQLACRNSIIFLKEEFMLAIFMEGYI